MIDNSDGVCQRETRGNIPGFPTDWVEILVHHIENPSGVWADYNPLMAYYRVLQQWVEKGLIDPDCLPDPPDVNDYTDLAAERSEHLA